MQKLWDKTSVVFANTKVVKRENAKVIKFVWILQNAKVMKYWKCKSYEIRVVFIKCKIVFS